MNGAQAGHNRSAGARSSTGPVGARRCRGSLQAANRPKGMARKFGRRLGRGHIVVAGEKGGDWDVPPRSARLGNDVVSGPSARPSRARRRAP